MTLADGPHHKSPRTAVHCVARPSTGFVHRDGPCRCFTGGPAPEFPSDPASPEEDRPGD